MAIPTISYTWTPINNINVQNKSKPSINNNWPIDFASFLTPWNTLPARQKLVDSATQAHSIWLPDVWNQILWIVGDLKSNDNLNNKIFDIYKIFGNNMQKQMGDKNSFYSWLDKNMLWELAKYKKEYEDRYWPNWQQMNLINTQFGNLWNYLLNKNASEQAISAWVWNKYWLSENAKRINNNDISLQWLNEVLKVFDGQNQAIDWVNKTFTQLTWDAFGKYKWIQDDYLKSAFDQNYWVQTQLSESLMNLLLNQELMKQKLAASWIGSYKSKSSTPSLPQQTSQKSSPAASGKLTPTGQQINSSMPTTNLWWRFYKSWWNIVDWKWNIYTYNK